MTDDKNNEIVDDANNNPQNSETSNVEEIMASAEVSANATLKIGRAHV